jgi:hypothetical protein
MKTIWKYNVGADDFSVEMPKGAQVLDVQFQGNLAQMWALVNPDNEMETRQFITYGTGHPIINSSSLEYVGTFQADWLVIHLFERNSGNAQDK